MKLCAVALLLFLISPGFSMKKPIQDRTLSGYFVYISIQEWESDDEINTNSVLYYGGDSVNVKLLLAICLEDAASFYKIVSSFQPIYIDVQSRANYSSSGGKRRTDYELETNIENGRPYLPQAEISFFEHVAKQGANRRRLISCKIFKSELDVDEAKFNPAWPGFLKLKLTEGGYLDFTKEKETGKAYVPIVK